MLKIGIIGCGKIAQVRHAPEYSGNPDCRITGFYDISPDQASALAEKYDARAYTSIDTLLSSGIDAVSICTANYNHAESAILALQKGKHVLCEKPMATTLADCRQMYMEARKSGCLLMLAHNQRFAPAHVTAKKLITEGFIGKVISFETHFCHSGPENWIQKADSWFFDKKRAQFGAMADLGIHKTDLIHYLTGDYITEVSSMLSTVDKKYTDGTPISVDDNAYCLYQTKNGIPGSMHVSWTLYAGYEDNSTRIYGTEGVLRIYDDPEYSLILDKKDGTSERFKLDAITNNKEQNEGTQKSTGVIDHFIDSILGRTTCRIDAGEALHAMEAIFAAEESSKTGTKIKIHME